MLIDHLLHRLQIGLPYPCPRHGQCVGFKVHLHRWPCTYMAVFQAWRTLAVRGRSDPAKSLLPSTVEEGIFIHLKRPSDLIASFLSLIDANLSSLQQEPLDTVTIPQTLVFSLPFILHVVCSLLLLRLPVDLTCFWPPGSCKHPQRDRGKLPHLFHCCWNRANFSISSIGASAYIHFKDECAAGIFCKILKLFWQRPTGSHSCL